MKTLKEISIENLNRTIEMIADNRRLLILAYVSNDNNAILKLEFQKQSLENELEYHKKKLEE